VKAFEGKITLVYAPKTAVEAAYAFYRKPLATRFQSIIDKQHKVAPEMLEEIFDDAMGLKASDIHFEPQEKDVIVRFRVDGVMHEAGRLPKLFYEGIVNRIKIEANLRIDEHYAAQDGAIRYKSKAGTMDVRVSLIPIVDGEKIVLRLLSEYVRNLTLADLGFSDNHRMILERAAHKPFGMLITTGPTGAGKSTTLYGLVKMRNRPDVNISTIEDPVEYKIPGINHIQVNMQTGLNFSKGLRALVRQDPDIVLVGEIRDSETATIAVNAALTGHLLFSTLHANDSGTAVPRLIEMGVEPFLLASTLEVIVAQRLSRRICPQCRFSYTLPASGARALFKGGEHYFIGEEPVTFYRGKGCEGCGNTGYRGRIGIYEVLEVNKDIEELITARKSSTDVLLAARKNGMQFLFEDGLEKVKSGMTTIDELMRIAAPPDPIFFEKNDAKKA
jgi:type II secretory ATPase GspE/PulE/Tfp pilus assembly ATPase PilB-like protein